MKTKPLPEHILVEMLAQSRIAALILGRNLNFLLDAYDFFVQRYPSQNPKEDRALEDLQVSIFALGSLPKHVAEALTAWTCGEEPLLSCEGFELNVLNEFNLHMNAVATFMHRKQIDLEAFEVRKVSEAFLIIRATNRVFTKT